MSIYMKIMYFCKLKFEWERWKFVKRNEGVSSTQIFGSPDHWLSLFLMGSGVLGWRQSWGYARVEGGILAVAQRQVLQAWRILEIAVYCLGGEKLNPLLLKQMVYNGYGDYLKDFEWKLLMPCASLYCTENFSWWISFLLQLKQVPRTYKRISGSKMNSRFSCNLEFINNLLRKLEKSLWRTFAGPQRFFLSFPLYRKIIVSEDSEEFGSTSDICSA